MCKIQLDEYDALQTDLVTYEWNMTDVFVKYLNIQFPGLVFSSQDKLQYVKNKFLSKCDFP